MIDMIKKAQEGIKKIIKEAYEKSVNNEVLQENRDINIIVEIPREEGHGDFSTNFAMMYAKKIKMPPKEFAKILIDNMDLSDSYFDHVEMAGVGFINFFLNMKWYKEVLDVIEEEKEDYGKNEDHKGEKIMVEFVSANPTGPMHVGNARGAVLGDTLSKVLKQMGCEVVKEFYVNDAGNQIDKFVISINARYMQLIYGEENHPFPEDGYPGDDIKEIAKELYNKYEKTLLDLSEKEKYEKIANFGLGINIPIMKEDLERYHVKYDNWFLESSLHESGYVKETLDVLTKMGLTYEKDDALWLNTSKLLVEKYTKEGKTPEQIKKLNIKDDVLCRRNGFYTYFLVDIAYHRNKFEIRGFDKVINIWGIDHGGHVARLQAALDGLGLDASNRLKIILMNFVNLLQDGKPVRMSKRAGTTITLHNLLDEISVDAARYFFNNRNVTSPVDFDLDLAKKTDSENPVYYIQYAYARICSVFENIFNKTESCLGDTKQIDTSKLNSKYELSLVKALSSYPSELKAAYNGYDTSCINRCLLRIATEFHRFYMFNKINVEDEEIKNARLKLADATRIVLKNGMDLLGLSTPSKM